MTLTIQDLKHFQQQHPNHRLELVDGAIEFSGVLPPQCDSTWR